MHGSDQECHLVGSSALVSASSSPSGGGLREAAYWVYLRQDIYMAILNQRPMKVGVSSISIPEMVLSTSYTSDCVWAKRMVAIMARIVAFCFGNGPKSVGEWDNLRTLLHDWNARKPTSFEPYYYRERNLETGQYWPEYWLTADWHGTYYYQTYDLLHLGLPS
jgi:hypothetical protein